MCNKYWNTGVIGFDGRRQENGWKFDWILIVKYITTLPFKQERTLSCCFYSEMIVSLVRFLFTKVLVVFIIYFWSSFFVFVVLHFLLHYFFQLHPVASSITHVLPVRYNHIFGREKVKKLNCPLNIKRNTLPT